jgi:ABC-type dipeptide/oligopeptide/nickel transport system permease component
MQRYLLSRLVQALVSVVAVSMVIFVVVRLTGDPMQVLMPPEATQADIAAARAAYGFDKSWPEQYGVFLSHAVRGDFGTSLRFRRPALDLVRERYPYSVLLGSAALLFALSVALPVGVYSAVHRNTGLDYFSRGMAAFGQAVPPFWLGLVLILLFGVIFHILPTSGVGTPAHLVLPAFTLGWFAVAGLTRLTRSAMLDVLGAEFIKLARLKGLPEHQVIWKHAFKNAALPLLTFAALLFVALLNGAIIVETVFNWPGVGLLVIEAVFNRDYPVVQTVVMILSTMYICANLVVDVLYAYVNPKIRYA